MSRFAPGTRRHVAQAMSRLMNLAVFPRTSGEAGIGNAPTVAAPLYGARGSEAGQDDPEALIAHAQECPKLAPVMITLDAPAAVGLVVRPLRVGKDGAHFDQTFFDDRCGVAAAPDAPGAKSPKGDGRGVDERQEPPVPLSFPFHQGLLSLLGPRSDGPSDGTVQAPIQRVKFRGGDRGAVVIGQLGHRLADISIVADDLFDTESKFAQVLTVQCAAPRDVCLGRKARGPPLHRIPRLLIAKRRGDLSQEFRQEEWNPMLHLRLVWPRRRVHGDPRPGALDELPSIFNKKLV
jgi:hypothetical protein